MSAVGGRRRAAWALLAGALALGAAAGWWTRGPRASAPATRTPRLLVDASQPLRAAGAFFPFTLAGPAQVRVEVVLPSMLEGEVVVGPLYAATRPELVYEPDAGEDRSFHVKGCHDRPWVGRFEHGGAYAVRVPPIPTAMGQAETVVQVRVHATYATP